MAETVIKTIDCNKSYIERKALSLFNIHIEDLHYLQLITETTEEETTTKLSYRETSSHEAYLCSLWLESAYDRVLEAFKWSFLTEPISFEEIDRGELTFDYGYMFAYKIITPYDEITEEVDKKTLVNVGSIYAGLDRRCIANFKRVGDIVYTNARDIKGYGIFKTDLTAFDTTEVYKRVEENKDYITLKDSGCPSEFIDLVAYQLALLIAPSIAPKDLQIQQLIAQQYQMANETLLKKECNQIKRVSNEEVE